MVKLQAATVSNQLLRKPRKRKRNDDTEGTASAESLVAESGTTSEHAIVDITSNDEVATDSVTTTVPTKTQDGGKKPRRTKTNGGKPALVRRDSSTIVETTIPWPPEFKKLEQIHKALNIVYTFCCTRKQIATSFETIKTAVEGNIKRQLTIGDIARVKALVPRTIQFSYVPESMLTVNLMGEENLLQGRRVKDFFPQSFREQENHYEAERHGTLKEQEILLFEFVDGDLKRQVTDTKTGEPIKATHKLRHEDLKMPVYSQKQMMKLIEKRNVKFTSAVNAWLNECAAASQDPYERLEKEHEQFIPQPSESRENTPGQELSKTSLPKTIPTERATIPEIVHEIKGLEWYTGQIVPDGHRVFDPQEPVYGELNFELSQDLVNALYNTRNIQQLYSHQAEAINALHEGHNVIVSTSTSSGKSLIYQLPVLHELERDPLTRAMYIFPTKALAQDQKRSLKHLLSYLPGLEDVVCETFDGDTPMADRNAIRDEARIIFTNPDMLHLTILPQEETWRTFLQNLKYVVMDELHVYNGLFGAHVSFIMRRLRRICAAVGNRRVKFVSCSATVANPEEHMQTIFGLNDVRLVDFDGSPSGRKEFLCWNTPFKDPGDPTSGRGDTFAETARLFCQLVLRGVRVIAFCRVRKQCEILTTAVKTELTTLERPEVMARIMAYRGGYTPQDRRRIEKEMFEGKLMGIVGTNALELGVDIGSLDAVVTVGFPYTIANLRQQSGRAGRRNKDSLSILVGDCFPTDQYYMANPDEIFTKPNCELQVDLTNMLVLEGHIQCAAHEMPVNSDADDTFFGKQLQEICEERLRKDDLGFYHTDARFLPHPSRTVAIRDTEDSHFAIVDTTHGRNVVLEELEASRAFFTIYEGGIFLHQGRTYHVKHMSTERMIAEVEYVKVDWTTQQRDYTDIDPIETEAIRRIPGSLSRAFFGTIKILQNVFGFFKVDKKRRILDAVQVDNPPIIIFSKGMWLDVPKRAIEILTSRRLNVAGAIHAAEHAILSLMPNFVISMPGDVKTECKVAIKEFAKKETSRKRPARLTFYDDKGGQHGSGIAAKAFEFIDLLLTQACERVEACHCHEGCLECCCSERCREANQVMSKAGAEVILKALLNKEIDVDSLPWGEEERIQAGIETVIVAEEVRPARGRLIDVVEVKREGGGAERIVVERESGPRDIDNSNELNNDDDVIVVKEEPTEEN
ncbi:P-loop containing nucleoside triphosphate hydrolase protein [Polychaeton citri CBS 116435]|uniref:P-loop containing nucleoside triphosphate hydrolase protein n=1 Tax=Polychaeton citri CBS 116435 TaxID=1314669 RepID=A0A9P4UUF1_9PEZI|nr:P-loop containing nucleoside triphosphate hydrolase protein [Polychaeton citri CBS 116435]